MGVGVGVGEGGTGEDVVTGIRRKSELLGAALH